MNTVNLAEIEHDVFMINIRGGCLYPFLFDGEPIIVNKNYTNLVADSIYVIRSAENNYYQAKRYRETKAGKYLFYSNQGEILLFRKPEVIGQVFRVSQNQTYMFSHLNYIVTDVSGNQEILRYPEIFEIRESFGENFSLQIASVERIPSITIDL